MSVGIGLLGCGTVGGGVAQLLVENAVPIARTSGVPFTLRAVAIRSLEKLRPPMLDARLLTADAARVVERDDIGLVIECIGGTGVARTLVQRALDRGKHVVTANKDLLATDGPQLAALAAARGVTLHYEAAVGGAIPIVRALADSLAGEDVLEVGGVLNGTTNFILTEMAGGATFAAALAQAQQRGYAEADATSDVEGIDAAHKLAILAQLAFRFAVTSPQIARRGISAISRDDVSLGTRLGWSVKLVACARLRGQIEASVTPAFVPVNHPFAQPAGANNCIRVIGRASGTLTFAGSGAGRDPTASAVIGDVIAALRSVSMAPVERLALAPLGPHMLAALHLPHVVRLGSMRDVRPAEQALSAAGYIARPHAHAPAVTVAPIALDEVTPLARTLEAAGVNAPNILPLWDDATASPAAALRVASA